MKKLILFFILLQSTVVFSQARKTENLIIFTMDGMRWQEIFGGIDSALMNNKKYTSDSAAVASEFWHDNVDERRKKLFPFLWSTVEENGQLYGNRDKGNFVNNANPFWFSYPGYNEIFAGYVDTSINSNNKFYNKNETVLEYINKQKKYKGKVAAFSTWDLFPYILNEPRSGVYVNSDVDSLNFSNDRLKLINDWQFLSTKPIGFRPDVISYLAGREYLKAYKPKVLYIAFLETDVFAHHGMYDQYLQSAHAQDRMVADMWKLIQSMPEYKNKTTLIVTCDHGRGNKNKEQWTGHGQEVKDSNEIWLSVMGPDSKRLGEVTMQGQLYQEQFAATMAALLGMEFKTDHAVARSVESVLK